VTPDKTHEWIEEKGYAGEVPKLVENGDDLDMVVHTHICKRCSIVKMRTGNAWEWSYKDSECWEGPVNYDNVGKHGYGKNKMPTCDEAAMREALDELVD